MCGIFGYVGKRDNAAQIIFDGLKTLEYRGYDSWGIAAKNHGKLTAEKETGKLPEMLLKIAEVYDDEVDNAVAALTSMLEPIMIVFLAVIVGTIVLALFTPLISIITGLQQQT